MFTTKGKSGLACLPFLFVVPCQVKNCGCFSLRTLRDSLRTLRLKIFYRKGREDLRRVRKEKNVRLLLGEGIIVLDTCLGGVIFHHIDPLPGTRCITAAPDPPPAGPACCRKFKPPIISARDPTGT